MKKFWWGIFFGALIGVLLLAPESNFSNRVRELFYTLQDSVVAILDAATQATGGMADGVDNLNKLELCNHGIRSIPPPDRLKGIGSSDIRTDPSTDTPGFLTRLHRPWFR